MRVKHRHRLFALEWQRATQQRVRHAPKSILIRATVHGPAADLLRRRVIRCAEELPGPGQPAHRQHAPGQPEIRQVHMPATRAHIHQHVRGLDITVDQPDTMRGI